MMIKPLSIFYITCGIVFGFLLFIYPASGFFITIIIIISYLLYKKVDKFERSFILSIFYSALFLRLVFILVTHILCTYYGFGAKSVTFPGMEGGGIFGDDIGIHLRAWALANMINGAPLSEIQRKTLLNLGEYGWSFHIYVLSFLYHLFGIVPVLGKCINALFGVLTGIIVYFITKELFGTRTAKLASILTVFYPTLILWSIANLKDTMLIFLVISATFCYILFQKHKQLRYLLLLLLSFFLVEQYRPGIIFILAFAVLISLLVNIKWNRKKATVAAIFGLAFLISANFYVYLPGSIKSKLNRMSLRQLILQQGGSVASGGSSTYKIYPERFYYARGYDKEIYNQTPPIKIAEFIISLGKGLFSLIFRPFPWEIDNILKICFYPISIIYNVLFFFFVIGVLMSLRYYFRRSIFLIALFITLSIFIALTAGNIGIMVRHRDMVTPIYIIFSSIGIMQLLSLSVARKAKQL